METTNILEKVELGRDDADTDKQLKHYFIKTPLFREILNFKKWLIVGRKGTGKTAIFAMIPEYLSKPDEIVIPLTPDAYSWGSLKEYKELGIPLEQAHTNAWKFTIISIAATTVLSRQLSPRLAPFKKFLEENFGTISTLALRVISAKLKAKTIGDLDFGPLKIKRTSGPITPQIIDNLQDSLFRTLRDLKLRLVILFDKLDDSWDGTNESKSLLIGLLKACQSLNGESGKKLWNIIFLRTDIYDMLEYHDKDKFRQDESHIAWNREDLLSIIAERIRYSTNMPKSIAPNDEEIWYKVFTSERFKGQVKSFKFIVDRTFLRPRDIISFCRATRDKAKGKNHHIVERADIREAYTSYSKWKLEDLITAEYKIEYPFLRDLTSVLRRKTHIISKSEICKDLAEIKTRNPKMKDFSNEQLIEILFDVNILGIYRVGRIPGERGGSRYLYRYMDSNVSPDETTSYTIHPSLHHALDISLKYKKRPKESLTKE